jgi:predicted glycosyltransferase
VASAGGGQLGEDLIRRCLDLAGTYPDVVFDIVQGPRSSLPWKRRRTTIDVGDNVRLHSETEEMPHLNASADLVISSGGYNSLLEALQGDAKILCFPLWKDRRDEQYRHAFSLKRFVDIDVSMDLREFPALFERALASLRGGGPRDRRRELNFDGGGFIETLVLQDLASRASERARDRTVRTA